MGRYRLLWESYNCSHTPGLEVHALAMGMTQLFLQQVLNHLQITVCLLRKSGGGASLPE